MHRADPNNRQETGQISVFSDPKYLIAPSIVQYNVKTYATEVLIYSGVSIDTSVSFSIQLSAHKRHTCALKHVDCSEGQILSLTSHSE